MSLCRLPSPDLEKPALQATISLGRRANIRGRVPIIESRRTAPRFRIRIRDDESGSRDGLSYPVSGYYACSIGGHPRAPLVA